VSTLIVFARAPVEGRVKTRLARAIGDEAALAVYVALLDDVCATAAKVAVARRVLCVDGDPDHPTIARFAARDGMTVAAQGEGDLGARMARALGEAIESPGDVDGRACVIGTDAPDVPAVAIDDAFAALGREGDVVLGPAADGGYWLVGVRGRVPRQIFDGMAWGTATVLDETLRRRPDARLVSRRRDVDDIDDLHALAAALADAPPTVAPATRQAIARLGLSG
jgi:hypothetical protein